MFNKTLLASIVTVLAFSEPVFAEGWKGNWQSESKEDPFEGNSHTAAVSNHPAGLGAGLNIVCNEKSKRIMFLYQTNELSRQTGDVARRKLRIQNDKGQEIEYFAYTVTGKNGLFTGGYDVTGEDFELLVDLITGAKAKIFVKMTNIDTDSFSTAAADDAIRTVKAQCLGEHQ